jgi:hypothetical protein
MSGRGSASAGERPDGPECDAGVMALTDAAPTSLPRTLARWVLGATLVGAGASHLTFARDDFRARSRPGSPSTTTLSCWSLVSLRLAWELRFWPGGVAASSWDSWSRPSSSQSSPGTSRSTSRATTRSASTRTRGGSCGSSSSRCWLPGRCGPRRPGGTARAVGDRAGQGRRGCGLRDQRQIRTPTAARGFPIQRPFGFMRESRRDDKRHCRRPVVRLPGRPRAAVLVGAYRPTQPQGPRVADRRSIAPHIAANRPHRSRPRSSGVSGCRATIQFGSEEAPGLAVPPEAGHLDHGASQDRACTTCGKSGCSCDF